MRLQPETIAGLRELGVERIGHVLDLPRGELTRRFGDEIVRRVDQLFGEAIEVIEPIRPSPPVRVERKFDGPTTRLDAVEMATRTLLDDLHEALLSREAGVCVLEFEAARLGMRTGEVVRETVMLGAPSRDAAHLWTLLRPRLERLHMGFGIEGLTLIARRTGALPHAQVERWRRAPTARADEASAAQLADVIANRLPVRRLELVDAHLPERTFRYVERPAHAEPSTPHLLDRPSLLLDPPEPAEAVALLPDRPPSWVRWRGIAHGVRTGIGPERVGQEWWRRQRETERRRDGETKWLEKKTRRRRDEETKCAEAEGSERTSASHSATSSLDLSVSPSLPPRDYFRVQTDTGLWLWVFRVDHSWFVHGLWI